MEYFDTHAHYDDKKFEDDREEVLGKIYNAGVTKCINMGCDIKSSKIAIDGTVTENLHSFGFVTPESASSEMLAAPSQYHIRRQFLSSTSVPSFSARVP